MSAPGNPKRASPGARRAGSPADAPGLPAERAAKRSGTAVNGVYEKLRDMVLLFQIRPGERVNEVELAEQLGVSRTPLRTALHRLAAEDMLGLVPNRGFYGRQLRRQEVFDLYELRNAIEQRAIALAAARASEQDIARLRADWLSAMDRAGGLDTHSLVIEDERFHVGLALLSGNQEMGKTLQAINARIHFVRWIDMETRRDAIYEEHLRILDAVQARDRGRCQDLIESHISHRMDEIVQVIQAGVIRLYAT